MIFEWDEDKNMIKRLAVTKGQEPTLEQLKEVEEAKKYPIEFDEDCPEL